MSRISSVPVLEFATLAIVVVACAVVLLPGGEDLVLNYLKEEAVRLSNSSQVAKISDRDTGWMETENKDSLIQSSYDSRELNLEDWGFEALPSVKKVKEPADALSNNGLAFDDEGARRTEGIALNFDGEDEQWETDLPSEFHELSETAELPLNLQVELSAEESVVQSDLSLENEPQLIDSGDLKIETPGINAFQPSVIQDEIEMEDTPVENHMPSQNFQPQSETDHSYNGTHNDTEWKVNPLFEFSGEQPNKDTIMNQKLPTKSGSTAGRQAVDSKLPEPDQILNDFTPAAPKILPPKTPVVALGAREATVQQVLRLPMSADSMLSRDNDFSR